MEDPKDRKHSVLVFFVNGKKVVERDADPEWTLLYYLRSTLRLPGAKLGCGVGGCGACTVMVSQFNRKIGKIKHYTLYACITPVVSLHGLSIITVEGLGSTRTRLHPVQERIARSHGTQCGFCTPGFVMSMYALLRTHPTPSMKDIEENLIGNLCRCTGYRPIIEGFSTFSGTQLTGCGRVNCCQQKANTKLIKCSKEEGCNLVSDNEKSRCRKEICCKNKSIFEAEGLSKETEVMDIKQRFNFALFDSKDYHPFDPSQEIIFPPSLKTNALFDEDELEFRGPRVIWFRPTTLERLVYLKLKHPSAKIIAGNTDISNELKYKNKFYDVYISSSKVEQLTSIIATQDALIIGASVTLSDVEKELKDYVKKLPNAMTKTLVAILEMLQWFGSKQVKNVATLGGNCANKSPISDLNPILVAARASLTFWNKDGERNLYTEEFLLNEPSEEAASDLLAQIIIPFSNENEHIHCFKQSRRRTDDISIVNAAMKVEFEPGTTIVKDAKFAFGGMDAKIKLAFLTNRNMKGQKWDKALLQKVISHLSNEFQLNRSSPGGMFQYRQTLVLSFFLKFFIRVEASVDKPLMCEMIPYEKPSLAASQIFEKKSNLDPVDLVGKPVAHSTAIQHATGEATFVDDIPRFDGELQAALVVSSIASGFIRTINTEKALEMDDVVAFFSAKDLQGDSNITGALVDDEELFVSREVKYVGHVIGVVVANIKASAKMAAKQIQIEYEEKPAILTIEEALEANSMWDPKRIRSGDTKRGFEESDHILEGDIRIGGQEHFYMETQTCIAAPNPGGEMILYSATQNPKATQQDVAKALGVDLNRVVCRTRRLGGGFGGKEIIPGPIAAYAAVAANKLRRPVRIVLERDEDMMITGGRHPFKATWKAGFMKNGTLISLQVDMYANAGYSLDISPAMATKAILHVDNVYRIPNTNFSITCCKTNLASNTACRGTGAPQSMLIMEDILTRISAFLKKDPHEVRHINMHKGESQMTHYGQLLEHYTIRQCWDEVLLMSQFHDRLNQVKKFNELNQYKKRGICAVPCKMAISFGIRVLEQAGALLHIYNDGSVLLSHGGIEMGQGLNTKMIQIASRELGIPCEKIHISENSTEKVPNASSTAASSSSDLNGMAVKEACEKIMKRLEPYRRDHKNGKWSEWVDKAYNDRVSLSATGFYKTPGLLDYDFDKQSGNPYNYFTYGAGVTEVEIDTLTGDHTVLRTDILMDVGKSLNPAIDIGQVEGAFIQGYGLYTLEEHLYTPQGRLITTGPSNYKIPGIQDIPCQFNVSLLHGSSNPRAIYSSRGIGEPPLFLAASVFFAIKEAIRATRQDKGHFRLDSPATAERIRMACQDELVREVMSRKEDSNDKPWCIRA